MLIRPEPPSLLVDTNCLISQVISDSKHRSPDRRTVEQLIKGLASVQKLPTSSSCMPTEPANAARVNMNTHTYTCAHTHRETCTFKLTSGCQVVICFWGNDNGSKMHLLFGWTLCANIRHLYDSLVKNSLDWNLSADNKQHTLSLLCNMNSRSYEKKLITGFVHTITGFEVQIQLNLIGHDRGTNCLGEKAMLGWVLTYKPLSSYFRQSVSVPNPWSHFH